MISVHKLHFRQMKASLVMLLLGIFCIAIGIMGIQLSLRANVSEQAQQVTDTILQNMPVATAVPQRRSSGEEERWATIIKGILDAPEEFNIELYSKVLRYEHINPAITLRTIIFIGRRLTPEPVEKIIIPKDIRMEKPVAAAPVRKLRTSWLSSDSDAASIQAMEKQIHDAYTPHRLFLEAMIAIEMRFGAPGILLIAGLLLSLFCLLMGAMATSIRSGRLRQYVSARRKNLDSSALIIVWFFVFDCLSGMMATALDHLRIGPVFASARQPLPRPVIALRQPPVMAQPVAPSEAPELSFVLPPRDATLHGKSVIEVAVADKSARVDHINLLADNKMVAVLRTKPYAFTFDTSGLKNNEWHRMLALAIDKFGTMLGNVSIVVRVENRE